MDITRDRLAKILDTGCNAIFTSKGMDDMSIKYLVDAGAIGVRRVDKVDMNQVVLSSVVRRGTVMTDSNSI